MSMPPSLLLFLLHRPTSPRPLLQDAAVDSKLKERELSFLQIFIPMLATDHEMEEISPVIKSVADEVAPPHPSPPSPLGQVFQTRGTTVKYFVGCGLETPRGCLRAQAIAPEVDFLCFDTDMLTQLVFGLSR
jgi:pyruvate, orthophosphate dikinase